MSLGDSQWELIDPTPNVHSLFVQFDKTFFWAKLENRAVVRWSKRMYSCAGICSYEGRGGICDIALSEPLLKLRPRKDMIETLLHEMIHAYLFISGGDRDRDGHGPNFQSHMRRINKQAGLNISIYHSFHDEVRLYQTHWWRCNGPCQHRKPYFGIVRRSANRTPGPNDYWWDDHMRKCGGTFIKIKEPEKKTKKAVTKKPPMGDITKYFTNTNQSKTVTPNVTDTNVITTLDINAINQAVKAKYSNNNILTNKKNHLNSFIVGDKVNVDKNKNIVLWDGNGNKSNDSNKRNSIAANNVVETVRNAWANKQINNNSHDNTKQKLNNTINHDKVANKRRSTNTLHDSPPTKITKINDYFNVTMSPKKIISNEAATSLLKDVYGEDFMLYQKSDSNSKIIAIQNPNAELVTCPICHSKICNIKIDGHLDECLSKEEINKICNETNELEKEKDSKIKTELDCSISLLETNTNPKPRTVTYDPKPSTSRRTIESDDVQIIDLTIDNIESQCPCCTQIVNISVEEHLEQCLSFMNDKMESDTEKVTIKTESGTNRNSLDNDVGDDLDESLIFNETGTKYPCPSCLKMFEQNDMNTHLDVCLSN